MRTNQKGAISVVIIVVVLGLIALGGTAYYFGWKESPTTPSTTPPSQSSQTTTQANKGSSGSRSPVPTATNELATWQEYLNERYHYKIKYPADWYFIQEGYSPPPPTTVVFSSLNNPYPPVSADRLSIEISVDQAMGRTLDNYEEIASLKSQYYQETRLTIDGEPAARINVPDPNSSEPISIYIQHKNYIYRIVWADNSAEFVQNRKLLDKILQAFTFTD